MEQKNVIYRFQQTDNIHEIFIFDEIRKQVRSTGTHGSTKILRRQQSILRSFWMQSRRPMRLRFTLIPMAEASIREPRFIICCSSMDLIKQEL